MRNIPTDVAAELASGATTFCRCWRAMRKDGQLFGFTDHDRDIAFNGMVFLAQTGLEATEAVGMLGLAVGGGEISGALVAEAIREPDIAAGLWDSATIETWFVDWRDPARRILLDTGQIGEISRTGTGFTAEIRSHASRFDQDQGRRYQALCPAQLGDAQCGVELTQSGRRILSSVSIVSDATTFAVPLIPDLQANVFSHGFVTLMPGLSGEKTLPVLSHTRAGSSEIISLWEQPVIPIVAGAQVRLEVGCDKRFATCRDRFSNAMNFRGFPFIPGNDFLMGYARQGDAELDGGVAVS